MSRWPWLAALLLVSAARLPAQEPSRLDPALRFARLIGARATARFDAAAPRSAGGPALGGAARPLPGAGALAATPDGQAYLRALVRLGPGGQAALERSGARIGMRAGDVVTARIPIDALAALAAEPAIGYIGAAPVLEPGIRARPGAALGPAPMGAGSPRASAAPSRRPAVARRSDRTAAVRRNDRGVAEAGFEGLRRREGDAFFGLAGQGVIVGIYDTGLDLAHGDFRGADGRTRVLYAWDQSAASGTPPGAVGGGLLDYGHECDRAAIDAGECPLVDRVGHGTHVAGIAAGDGSATGNGLPAYRYTGAAPAADLIVVKGGDDTFTADRLIEGVAYIFARAAELGRPAVVNLSIGTLEGPHDGTTPLETALNALVGPGRIIVAGAGNHGANGNVDPPLPTQVPLHALGRVAEGGTAQHDLVIPEDRLEPGAQNDGVALELWYEGADSLTLTVVPPGGGGVRVATGDTALVETGSGAILVDNGFGGPQEINGDHKALIVLFDADEATPPAAGRWTIRVEGAGIHGSGAYHLWLVGHSLGGPLTVPALEGGTSNSHLVNSPATADRILAVAAYATRHEWRSADDAAASFPIQESLGDIAFFSSPGPRRDEGAPLKPELAAPGKVVISARAAGAPLWDGLEWLIEADGVHAALFGTSMAAPYVTGAVALLLQLDPGLTPEQARDLLTAAAGQDAFTRHPYTGDGDGAPNAQWGFGKLDVAAAAATLRPPGLFPAGERVNLSANPVRGDELLINYAERPRALRIYTPTGERVRGFGDAELGDWLAVWGLANDAGRSVANGVYLLVADFAQERVVKKIFVVRP